MNQLKILINEQQLTCSPGIFNQIEEFIIGFNITPEAFMNHLECYMINNKLTLITEQIIKDIQKKIQDDQFITEKLKEKSTQQSGIKKQSFKPSSFRSIFDANQPTELDKAFLQQEEQTQSMISCNDYLSSQFHFRNYYKKLIKIEIEHPSKSFQAFLQQFFNFLNEFREERKLQVKQEILDKHELYSLYLSKSFLYQNQFQIINVFRKGSLENKRKAINSRFAYLQEQFLDHAKNTIDPQLEFADLSIPTQENSFAFGRILCDSEGKINEKSIIFDKEDLATKISLDITKIDQYVLFPNQHIIVEGVHSENTTEFICSQIVQKSYQYEINEKEQQYLQLKSKQLNVNNSLLIMAASGPFTTNDSLNYTPLQSFLVKLKDLKPEIIILFGPFVDKNHSIIKEGLIQIGDQFLTYQDVFEQILESICQIIQVIILQQQTQLQKNFNFDNTKIIIVPSPEDKTSIFTSLPQPRFETRQPLPPNFYLVTNPSQLLINDDIQFHLLNSSLIKDLLTSSIYKFPNPLQNRITACLQELLYQRSLCPIYPLENSMNLEYWQEFILEDSPKIVILPSIISEFATVINETIFINPGCVCKANKPGTYAEIAIYFDKLIPFQNRTRVDIKAM